MLRRTLRALIIFVIGAGLVAFVYIMRPDVPVGSVTSHVQPTTRAHLESIGMTGPVPIGASKPISSDLDKATIRPAGAKRLDGDEPRAELARKPRALGWGDSYAVRLTSSSGQRMVVLQIVLIAHMADGTVESVAMGALPERGVYRATVPTRRSAPTSLQVRVRYGKQWVEIPVAPPGTQISETRRVWHQLREYDRITVPSLLRRPMSRRRRTVSNGLRFRTALVRSRTSEAGSCFHQRVVAATEYPIERPWMSVTMNLSTRDAPSAVSAAAIRAPVRSRTPSVLASKTGSSLSIP